MNNVNLNEIIQPFSLFYNVFFSIYVFFTSTLEWLSLML